ncbi:MAG: YdbL family protein [Desulfotignum sp.]|nr:YdbL family protein [Desulfotignum sp.]MCF8089576.1 YdbL family protein [Desulfotignum sp.]MCF8136848.1 YdbL family protein [Desulfotignum sp.]
MRIKLWTLWMIIGIAAVLTIAGSVPAQGIKERMKERLPVIVELKTQGIVGENNRGYLDFVGNVKTREALIAQENQDRKTVYAHIAKQQNTSLSVVEKNRALQLIERAAPGTYVQMPDGAWVQK